jgi:primosomal protein N' (replication factor Y) (superfamily II helicase)
MYILVRLLKGYPKPLFYKFPDTLNKKNLIGKIVKVPIKNNMLPALVLKVYNSLPSSVNFEIRETIGLEKFPTDPLYNNFIKKISEFYFIKPIHFYQRIKKFLFQSNKKNQSRQTNIDDTSFHLKKPIKKISLTQEQKNVVNYIEQFIENTKYAPILLHGATGSGKTEIYKKLIVQSIKKNQSVILLLPEVSLSLQFQNLLKNQLPKDISIIGFHSASKASEKKYLWQRLLEGKPTLIIGVHLPILLPISNLGLIIVDEEHETGFQEKKHPKINSKELAIWRANYYKIPILLGSATPSLNSLFNVNKNNWKLFQLKKRFSGNFPKIKQVFFDNKNQKRRKNFWITRELENEIKQTLEKKEQTIIYLNRRGYSFFVQCKNCGFIFECPNCSVSLTLHKKTNEPEHLRCHYCDYQKNMPLSCPECELDGRKHFLKKGIGTQQVVTILQNLFPDAKIERADLDSTSKKRSWRETVEKFENGELDILVGTQTITKGYHFPKVTLVGILWADLNLHFPVFNASETTLQQLIQVAGRAGRQCSESKVIVQTMQNHYIFNHLNEQDYLNFCKKELELRKEINYPPFGRLVQIELKNTNSMELEAEAHKLCENLHKINNDQNLDIQILGPARPVVHRIQKTESRQIFLKTKNFQKVHFLLENIDLSSIKSHCFVVPTP